DIKPGNLLVSKEGVVKILDMGLAQLQSSEDNNGQKAELTQSGRIMGTVDYMAPEQALDAKTVDQRADIYSLGCTLYYLLAGQPMSPDGTLTQKLLWHQTETVPSLKTISPEVTDELDTIFHKMVAKKPGDRFASMGELLEQLDPLLATIPPEQMQLPSLGVGLSRESGSATDHGTGRGKLTMVERGTRTDYGGALGLDDSSRAATRPLNASSNAGVGKLLPILIGLGVLSLLGVAAGISLFMFLAPPNKNGNGVATAGDEGQLIVAASLPNAQVYVDDNEVGQTNGEEPYNLELKLPPGDYKIRVQKTGFAAFENQVTLQAGKPLTLQAPLGAQPAVLTLTVDVPGAVVSVDGRPKGTPEGKGPYRLTINDVTPGPRIVRIEAEGYEPKESSLDLKSGETFDLPLALTERPFRALLSWVFANADKEQGVPVVLGDANGLAINAKRWADVPAKYAEVREINLTGSAVQTSELPLLKQANTLRALSLASTAIDDDAVKTLGDLTSLERLNLSKTAVGDKNLSYLNHLTKLVELDLRGTKLSDMGLQSLAEIPSLETLHLSGTNVGDDGIKQLAKLKELQLLSVDGTRATYLSYEAFNTAGKKNPINKAELDPELGIAYRLLRSGA
ncbi:MAG TPA: PEGA domain-containing protein, partial [Pirellulaceae bacterium]|nr:PEGA domain-containing protein [Pirellulaceae bacterium]